MTTTQAAGIGTATKLPITDLNTHHKNPRRGDVEAIAGSLAVNGQFRPIVVNKGTHTGRPMEVLAGNHTLKAMRHLAEKHPDDTRWHTIDTYLVDVDDDRATRIVLADNRTADLGHYDNDELLDLLDTLDGEYEGTGYDEDYIGALLGENTPDDWDPDNDPDANTDLNPHRLLVGDSTNTPEVQRMMNGDQADCIWTDPPYGVNYVGKTKDALTIENDGAGDLNELLTGAYRTCIETSKPGAPVYVAHSDTERARFESLMVASGIIFRQNLIWVKNTLALGRSDYHYRHEPILYGFTPGGEGRLGRGGERWYGDDSQTTVFEVDKPNRNADHPTMKPPELIHNMLRNSCPRNGIVLDPFAGSGSTMVAAHQLGARARMVEYDPRYGDVICRRWEALTGETPQRDGKPVSFLAEE